MIFRALVLAIALLAAGPACHAQNLDSLDAAVRAFTRGAITPSYGYVWVSLASEDKPAAVVLLQGGEYCGSGGCTLVIFRSSGNGLKLVSSSTISSEPLGVLTERKHGWRTLLVTTRGKGAVLMRFDGSRYPLNPSLQTVASKEQVASAEILKLERSDPSEH
jgi:hypothetical protein